MLESRANLAYIWRVVGQVAAVKRLLELRPRDLPQSSCWWVKRPSLKHCQRICHKLRLALIINKLQCRVVKSRSPPLVMVKSWIHPLLIFLFIYYPIGLLIVTSIKIHFKRFFVNLFVFNISRKLIWIKFDGSKNQFDVRKNERCIINQFLEEVNLSFSLTFCRLFKFIFWYFSLVSFT